MKTLREMMDLIESAQAPVAEGYTPTAGELARDLIKMPDSDFNKKYGMSKQQANRYYSSSKLKEPGVSEGFKYIGDRRKFFALRKKSVQELDGIINSATSSTNDKELAKRVKAEKQKTGVAEGTDNDLTPYEAGEADGLSGEYYENPYPEGNESYAEFRLGWRAGTKQAEANRDIDEQATPEAIARIERLSSK